MKTLFTIGYEGAALEDFLAALRNAGVRCLVDVRDVPISRKPGFSKKALSAAVENAGIGYVHLKGLGTPKEGRDAARAGNRDAFLRIFAARLKTREAREDLTRAVDLAGAGDACLVCYERDPARCHRTLVAREISDVLDIDTEHLYAN